MPEYLNQLLADSATALVNESFTGVSAPWWWERRIGGGIEVCQELDPGALGREISARTGRDVSKVRTVIAEELGLEDDEPVVLTFEIAGETETSEVARMLAERSSEPEGQGWLAPRQCLCSTTRCRRGFHTDRGPQLFSTSVRPYVCKILHTDYRKSSFHALTPANSDIGLTRQTSPRGIMDCQDQRPERSACGGRRRADSYGSLRPGRGGSVSG